MNNITSIKEKENIDTIKNDKTAKLTWFAKLGPNLTLICMKYFCNFTA